MADIGQGTAERDAEEADDLLFIDDNSSVFRLDPQPLKLDHCDLLLDAIDAELGQLQVQPQKHQEIFIKHDCSKGATLKWSHSLSKDTGLESTTQKNDSSMSRLDLIHIPMMEKTPERSSDCWGGPLEETNDLLDRRARDKDELESRREQVIWRLERLLGDTCREDTMAGETNLPSDSICTEDFVRRFREEMVELGLPESNMQNRDNEEEAERKDIFESDTCQSAQKGQNGFNFKRRGLTTPGKSSRNAGTHCSQSNKAGQPEDLENCLSGVVFSQMSGKAHRTLCEDTRVPVRNFDTVSVASDLDSVCTVQVRQHIHKLSGWHALIQAVTGADDSSTNHSDTPTQEESEPQATSVHRYSNGNVQKRSPSVRTARFKKRLTYRHVCSLGDNNKDTDEEINHCSERCRSDRTSEKTLSDLAKTKERLTKLKQKCEKEEKMLKVKRTQLNDVEFCLSELRLRRKHSLQALEKLTAEKAQMEKEKRGLESVLSSSRLERDSVSCQLQKLQKQKESHLREIRAMEEELATLSDRRKSLKDRFYVEKGLEVQVNELQVELGECNIRVGTLEKMLAQRDVQLQGFQVQCGALQAERDELKVELQHLKTQSFKALKEVQEQAHRMTVNQQAAEEKETALKEETLALTQCITSMQSSIQLRDEEAKELRKSLEQQREEAKNREEELHVEASEKVHKKIEEERRKWEAEKANAVQMHCGILEQQNRKSQESIRSELQQEKSKAQALQHKVVELKTRVQELESESCVQQREQDSLLAVICKSLKEEHEGELQRLKKQMAQESQRTVLRHKQAAQLAEKEARRLQIKLEERESSHNQITAEIDQKLRHWAQELGKECQHLHLLVEQSGTKQNNVQLPDSSTVAEALMRLRALREQLEHFINHLHQELDSQKQITEQLRKDKEQELSILEQQLRMERDQALDSLKERLIQDHIEELSSLNRAHMSDEGVAASLRKQLKAKDLELRQVQRSMGQWKEQTAARLACKFEEELTADLERCKAKLIRGRTSNTGEESQSKSERPEREMRSSSKEIQNSVCSPYLHLRDLAAPHSPSDVASFKLLHYLQSRVKQLRLENQGQTWSSSPTNTVPLDLSGFVLQQ